MALTTDEPTVHDAGAGRMTLVEHLTELRRRIIIATIALAVGTVIAFAFYNHILGFLIHPYCVIRHLRPGQPCTLIVTDPLEGFAARLKVSAYSGLVLASPVVLWQVWRFITPGLNPKEKKYAVPFIASSIVLFLMGAVVGLLTFPKALQFLGSIGGQNTEVFYRPAPYLGLVVLVLVAFGLSFEFPILLVFLELAGVVSSARLRKWRRPAIVIIVVAAAVITPSQDPISLFAMAIPMYVFYEVSILIGRILKK
ncbi:MAG: sec-independent protein translocase protein TatC [Actinomycetota bacterium]|nr:sec-independent protein translocase protein TatC [Actinomycetota bacterium]